MNDCNLILSETSPALIQEAFNTIRTNLSFTLSGEKSKIIAITGAKNVRDVSTVALNLAISFSQIADNKVLLIDGDMHKASLSETLELTEANGFSDCLSGKAVKENCIVSSKGIDILPSGTKPSNAANLLDSRQMANLCEDFKKCYDYIFIVLPPASLYSDAVISVKFVDGFLPVVHQDTDKFAEVKKLLRNLRIANGKILGFVYSGATVSKKNAIV